LSQFLQQLPNAAGSAQFSGDIGRQPQISLGVEPARLDIGRQFAHGLGESEEDLLDLTRLETPFPGQARASLRLEYKRLDRTAIIVEGGGAVERRSCLHARCRHR
jgi:hypothetical protein